MENTKKFLPVSKEDMKQRGWDQLDFIIISGDAYVDHPSFGVAIIGRLLESNGYRVGIIPQPSWKDLTDFKKLGRPKLGFFITGGNIDSMVNHYTVAKKRRKKDSYSPGGKMGMRPDRASIVYSQKIKEAFKNVPVILGGLEASLRRLAHYDYWEDRLRRSILLDARADLLIYGMGEKQVIEIAEALESGISLDYLNFIEGTVFKCSSVDHIYKGEMLPSFDEIIESKEEFAKSFIKQYKNTDPFKAVSLIEPYRHSTYVVQNPPPPPLTTRELDAIYLMPFKRTYHPMYEQVGGVPAIKEVKYSLVSSRGCFGGCSFCALHFHQGRIVQTRSTDSILEEAQEMIKDDDFKGYIHDVGGPTANFRKASCKKQFKYGVCQDRNCLVPEPCKNLEVDHGDYLELLKKLRGLEGVKKVFIRSGIRFDYLIHDEDETFFEELCKHHISGQLKVAPEHVSNRVLKKMNKPPHPVYERFKEKFSEINNRYGLEQYLVPYFLSSHPGSDLHDAIRLAEYVRDIGYNPEQVQDFYPTPGTLATCMYYTELDPRTMEKIYVAKTPHQKAMQRALIQYRNPKNYHLVYEALKKAGREDLIGYGEKCLIRPKKPPKTKKTKKSKKAPSKNFRKGSRKG